MAHRKSCIRVHQSGANLYPIRWIKPWKPRSLIGMYSLIGLMETIAADKVLLAGKKSGTF